MKTHIAIIASLFAPPFAAAFAIVVLFYAGGGCSAAQNGAAAAAAAAFAECALATFAADKAQGMTDEAAAVETAIHCAMMAADGSPDAKSVLRIVRASSSAAFLGKCASSSTSPPKTEAGAP